MKNNKNGGQPSGRRLRQKVDGPKIRKWYAWMPTAELARLAEEYPQYDWRSNKGYPTREHRDAIRQYGITPYHRKSFSLLGDGQLSFDF